ncbi:hypothetical protein FRC17_010343 [Serendipita sp. 399]|nr:hypothetical protein FRC17_010343 [Serendipita sp. 399]
MSKEHIATTGVTSNPNNPVARQEIRTFAKDKELWDLYLLGLERFQAVNQDDPLSYFQIAGIHGRPYIPYDDPGARNANENAKAPFGGYCTHSSILFPPWHRPYLALFEQVLAKHVTDIANEYRGDVKAKYVSAAQRFRIPYWDWAANPNLPDSIAVGGKVTVNSPDGPKTLEENPLYSYKFHPVYPNLDGLPRATRWDSYKSTVRYPKLANASDRDSALAQTIQVDFAKGVIANNKLTLRDRTYILLTQYKEYGTFSNNVAGTRPKPNTFESLESIHGTIHRWVGDDGHMSEADYAAFDPIFWLHHCNVDRLFALWQALNDSYVTAQKNRLGNFSTPFNESEGWVLPTPDMLRIIYQTIDIKTPLRPFRKPDGEPWTSAEVWSESSVRTEINRLYAKDSPVAAIAPKFLQAATATATLPNEAPAKQDVKVQKAFRAPAAAVATPASSVAQASTEAAQGIAAPLVEQPVMKSSKNIDLSVVDDPAVHDGKHYIEWVANITTEKYAAKNTFSVHVFLGDFSIYALQWAHDPHLVGTHVIFANDLSHMIEYSSFLTGVTGCERCHNDAERQQPVTGMIPLTGALGDRLGKDKLGSLTPELVVPYLQKELHWRVQNNNGTVVERSEIPSLKVSVAHFVVTIPQKADEFPVWDDGHTHPEITDGRLGGANHND